jgi:hypothetical protein
VRRWGLPAALAFLLALGAAWGAPRAGVAPVGAGPAPVLVALPAGITQLAVTPRADPRAGEPAAVPPPVPQGVPTAAPAAAPARATALSPTVRSAAGGRAPPAVRT